MDLAALRPDDRLDVLLPVPARIEVAAPDNVLTEVHLCRPAEREALLLVRIPEVLPLDIGHGRYRTTTGGVARGISAPGGGPMNHGAGDWKGYDQGYGAHETARFTRGIGPR